MTQNLACAAPPAPKLIDGKYHFLVNEFIPCDWCAIFNRSEFFDLHKSGRAFYFQLGLGNPVQAVGVAHFTEVQPGFFRSPRRGTFGGFEFRRSFRIEAMEAFVDEVEAALRFHGATKIEIVEPAAIFDEGKSALISNILQRRGYRSPAPDLDYFLAVDQKSIWDKLHASRRQRINRCRRDGMVVEELNRDCYPEAYEVIVQNRRNKGFPVTMSFEAIQAMREAFPDHLVFFAVFKRGVMIASSICVKVNASILYVFYWGDLPGYEKFSPVSLLAEYIYEHARTQGYHLIDLGTTTKDGMPMYGLINFKKEIGAVPSLKSTYVKFFDRPGHAGQ